MPGRFKWPLTKKSILECCLIAGYSWEVSALFQDFSVGSEMMWLPQTSLHRVVCVAKQQQVIN